MFENNVAKAMCFTTFPKGMLLKPLISIALFLELSAVKSFSHYVFEKVVKSMVLATLIWNYFKTNGSNNIMLGHVVKPMIPATLFSELL